MIYLKKRRKKRRRRFYKTVVCLVYFTDTICISRVKEKTAVLTSFSWLQVRHPMAFL